MIWQEKTQDSTQGNYYVTQKFSKLTRPNSKKLTPGQKIVEHGIEFERLKDFDGRYLINIMVDGQRVHRVVGKESEGVTRTQAEELIEQLRTEARRGRLNLPKGRKLHVGFSEAADKYLKLLEQEDGKDLKSKKHRLRDHLKPFFGNKSLSKITTFDMGRYKKHRLDSGAASGTINRELLTLSHILNKAIEWGWIEYRPCVIKKLKEPPGRIIYLTVEQVNRLLEEAMKDACSGVYPFILIGVETGMRRMEILSIRLEHIDLERRIIYIPKAKAGSREQPITKNLCRYLKSYIQNLPEGTEWLFPAPESKTGHKVAIEKPFRRVVKAAELDPKEVTRHTLRHTAISHLVQAGVDLPTIKRISGHSSVQMVERYSHQNGEHIQAAMDKLERRYRFTKN